MNKKIKKIKNYKIKIEIENKNIMGGTKATNIAKNVVESITDVGV
jgi:hypothetical protein